MTCKKKGGQGCLPSVVPVRWLTKASRVKTLPCTIHAPTCNIHVSIESRLFAYTGVLAKHNLAVAAKKQLHARGERYCESSSLIRKDLLGRYICILYFVLHFVICNIIPTLCVYCELFLQPIRAFCSPIDTCFMLIFSTN